jgi:hypothetical protein
MNKRLLKILFKIVTHGQKKLFTWKIKKCWTYSYIKENIIYQKNINNI